MQIEQIIQMGVFFHAGLGGIALIAGTIILFLKKGTKRHKQLGRVFFYAMLLSCLLAIVIAIVPDHESPFLFSIGLFSLYLILTGKRALRFKRPHSIKLGVDKAISVGMLCTALGMILGPYLSSGSFNVILSVFGGIGFLLSAMDMHRYRDRESLKRRYIRLHIGKIMGGYIAAITAFLVVNQFFPSGLNWFAPTIFGSIYITYWLRRYPIRLTN